jgi:DNA invertase Pin-like site-specific DNA recombinase
MDGPHQMPHARISTDGQSVDAQVRQLTRAGCKKVLHEVASGAKTDRRRLRRALDQLGAGDVLMVTRLDRLARSTRNLLNPVSSWQEVTEQRQTLQQNRVAPDVQRWVARAPPSSCRFLCCPA